MIFILTSKWWCWMKPSLPQVGPKREASVTEHHFSCPCLQVTVDWWFYTKKSASIFSQRPWITHSPFRTDEVRTCKIDLESTSVEPMKLTESQIHGPSIYRALKVRALPVLGLMLCCNCHEILIILFWLRFVSEVKWRVEWARGAEKIHKTCVSIVPSPSSANCILHVPWAQKPSGPIQCQGAPATCKA